MQSPDLIALVIELRALMPTYIDNHMGRAIQHVGWTLINQHNADLATAEHDKDDKKPFTVSGLMKNGAMLFGEVNAGDRAWMRFTGLSSAVSAALMAYYNEARGQLTRGTPVFIELDRLTWAVSGVHLDTHPWGGCTTYQSFIERHRHAQPHHKLSLTFHTPTTFRSQTVNMPLPLPYLVFGSLLDRWMAFTSHRLRDLPQDQLAAYIAHHVLLSRHDIQTEMVRGKQRGKEIGFTGSVTYELAHKSDHLHKHDPELETLLLRERLWFARTLGLLADFAFYSGIGRKTTTGMGMARQIGRG